eukprot:11575577-Karenia_brevis.AAC.1
MALHTPMHRLGEKKKKKKKKTGDGVEQDALNLAEFTDALLRKISAPVTSVIDDVAMLRINEILEAQSGRC